MEKFKKYLKMKTLLSILDHPMQFPNYMLTGLLKITGKRMVFMLVMESYLITKVLEEDPLLLPEKLLVVYK